MDNISGKDCVAFLTVAVSAYAIYSQPTRAAQILGIAGTLLGTIYSRDKVVEHLPSALDLERSATYEKDMQSLISSLRKSE